MKIHKRAYRRIRSLKHDENPKRVQARCCGKDHGIDYIVWIVDHLSGATLVINTASDATINTKIREATRENNISRLIFLFSGSVILLPNAITITKATNANNHGAYARNSLCSNKISWSHAVSGEDFKKVLGPPVARYGA